MRIKTVFILLGYCAFVSGAAAQKTSNASTDAVKIYEDLPLDVPGKTSVLKPHETVAEKIRDHIFIKTVLSKKTCFVGEPLKLTYELYSALQNKSEISRRPSYKGFTMRQIDFSNDEDNHQKLNGSDYRVFTVAKNILIPYETGRLSLEPVEVHNTVSYEDGIKGQQQYEGIVSSKEAVITVLALPALKTGEMFSGAVGKFSMKVTPEKMVLSVNENNRIVIELSGTGNLSDVSLPIIHWPDHVEIFDGSQKIQDLSDDDFHTSKVFTMTAVMKKPGKYAIEPVCITAFNPEKGTYEKICSQSFELNVQTGTGVIKEAAVETKSSAKKSGTVPYLVAAVIVALGTGLSFFAWKKKRKKIDIQKKAIPEEAFKQPPATGPDYGAMAEASLALEKDGDFIHSFKYVMKQYMADSTKMEIAEPYDVLLDRLAATNAAKADAIKALTAESDYLLYSPGGVTAGIKKKLVNRFLETLNI